MKRLKKFFINLSFRKKIISISLCISFIPVFLIGVFSYMQTYSILLEHENTVLKDSLEQKAVDLDYKFNSYINAMNFVIWNENMRSSLSKTYKRNIDMYIVYRDVIDPLFLNVRSLNTAIKSVTVYTDNPIYPHNNILRPISDIYNLKWYKSAQNNTAPFFDFSQTNGRIALICRMYYQNSVYNNIIYMSIDSKDIFSSLKELSDQPYGVLILSGSNDAVFKYENFSNSKDSLDIIKSPNDDYVVKKTTLTSIDGELYFYRPVEEVSATANKIAATVIIIMIFCLFAVLMSSVVMSRVVVKPLEDLTRNMQKIEQGDLSIYVKQTSFDEIGYLIQTFGKMVERLQYLIDEVLKNKIAKQEYEIKALQAQINPHFLYNSLSLINGKAIIAGEEEICQIAQLLSSFYRTSLNKGKDLTTVKDELKNITSYIQIQQIMHSNSFDVTYDIDENLYPFKMLNFLLQPLVENAIIHGIDCKESSGRGVLTISCRKEDEFIVFKITDNGCGMSEEECKNILFSESKGYGIQNVHKRIQLYYGNEYGLSYTSTKGKGTCAVLTIPAQK